MPDLLIELLSEEIPARLQARARADLQARMTDGLVEAGLTYASAAAFSTPRRLVLTVEGLSAQSQMQREERKGPRVDAPEQALQGFLRATGLTKDQLQMRDDKKGQVWFAVVEKPGRPAVDIVAEVLDDVVRNFPWPKSMRWGDGTLRWVRPLQSVLCLLSTEAGAETVPLKIDGLVAGNTTEGHRFMGGQRFSVVSFDDYAAKLKKAQVMLDPAEREQHIWHDATNMAFAQGLEVVEDKGLLTEVAGLVEWPVVLMGRIGDTFLDLPAEVLQTSMKEHQKFFSVREPKTGRIVRFVTVANRETADNGATILAGNQKVLAARLSDAKFFWDNDLRQAKDGMGAWLKKLDNVTFHNGLGTQGARISRIAALARHVAPLVGADADRAQKAAEVAKADLASEMVYEFPELQGVMGRYYAQAAGLDGDIAEVAEMHYKPLGPSDEVPTHPLSIAVSMADKLDTLTGFWAIDEKPTGSKDPFALRRAALGVIRLVLNNELRIGLERLIDIQLLTHTIALHTDTAAERDIYFLTHTVDEIARHGVFGAAFRAVIERFDEEKEPFEVEEGSWLYQQRAEMAANSDDLMAFFHDRLKVHLRDDGMRHDVIDACLAMPSNDDLTLLVARATALAAFLNTEDGENLVQGFKRANNILIQAEEADGVEYRFGADVKFAEDETEKALFTHLDRADEVIAAAMQDENFGAAMGAMAALRAPIDAFFEAVQVNTDNQIVRRNRLNLLHRIREICLRVADLTKLEG